MRPSLQRLLRRPAAFRLLCVLVGRPRDAARWTTLPPAAPTRRSVTAAARERPSARSNGCHAASAVVDAAEDRPTPRPDLPAYNAEALRNHYAQYLTDEPWRPRTARRHLSLPEREFESSFHEPSDRPRLMDNPQNYRDFRVWEQLLMHRRVRYGAEGVEMIWREMRDRDVDFPTRNKRGYTFWATFLYAGLEHSPALLEEIVTYADALVDKGAHCWEKLYYRVVLHMLIHKPDQAVQWHRRLLQRHSPDAYFHDRLFSNAVARGGDLQALKEIYAELPRRELYHKLIPLLCLHNKFEDAKEWHYILVADGDGPHPKLCKPLLSYYSVFDPKEAKRLQVSLDAHRPRRRPFEVVQHPEPVTIGELANLSHGATFRINPKSYNDELGARWLATDWLSLDVVYSGIQALGVRAIGPLSLQAIALRNPDPTAVLAQIRRLNDFDISVEDCVYTRAVEHFAILKNAELLETLLASDQFPANFEDRKLQEFLLVSSLDQQKHREVQMILEICALGEPDRIAAKDNLLLQCNFTRGRLREALSDLEKMLADGRPVFQRTIHHFVHTLLDTRPDNRKRQFDDHLHLSVSVLTKIMDCGNPVPVNVWAEILRRLCKLGQLEQVHRLSVDLVLRYGTNHPPHDVRQWKIHQRTRPSKLFKMMEQLNDDLKETHLKEGILFPRAFLRGLVTWSLVHRLVPQQNVTKKISTTALAPFTIGLSILRDLRERGVSIDPDAIRSILLRNLVFLYYPHPPPQKDAPFARLRRQNPYSLDDFRHHTNRAFGASLLPDNPAELQRLIEARGLQMAAKSIPPVL